MKELVQKQLTSYSFLNNIWILFPEKLIYTQIKIQICQKHIWMVENC